MSDYQTIEAANTRDRIFSVVARADGSPITSGTVNYYLKALSGGNAGKWWRDSDQTWQASETANAMTHAADGHWTRALAATPWTSGVEYLEYVKESGDLHIPICRGLHCEYTPSADSNRYASADAVAISGDVTAADYLEAMLDGTGATLTLDQLRIDADDINGAIHVTNASGPGMALISDVAYGLYSQGDLYGAYAVGSGASGTGMLCAGGPSGKGLQATGGSAEIDGDITGSLSGSVGSVTSAVTAGTVTDKAGYALASDGLDSISVTAPAGVASDFREMLVQLWRRFFRKSTMTASELKTYADNGTDVLTTQTVSEDGTTQTQGAAS